jgi:hypothetical protein
VKRAALLLTLALTALAFSTGPSAATARGLRLGLADVSFGSSIQATRDEWLSRAREAGAQLAMLNAVWSAIAPHKRPAGFDAANPADPSYDWRALDGAVRSAVAQGLEPVVDVDFAPSWAEGPGRPSIALAPPGTWLPSAPQLGLFAAALASRYSGDFVDPAEPGAGPLPRVRYFQIWAEQNLSVHLTPLWRGRRLVGPFHYRAMLNAAYAGIHGASPGAKVIVGGLAPYGDARAGASRIPPVWFWRALLCLRGARLKPSACPEPAHFDIAAHNPIDVFAPTQGAVSPLDVSTPDIGRLTRIVRRAVAAGRALPVGRKPFWATEIWWDSRPPDPRGVPVALQARYLTRSLFELWRQGVGAVIWWYLRDQAPGTAGFAATQQSGLLFRDGLAKPSFTAFRFPFLGQRQRGGGTIVWGRAPRSGRLTIERRRSQSWSPLTDAIAGPDGVFFRALRSPVGRLVLRAHQGSQSSLSWRLR